jgi:hypothetical protein
MQMLKRGSLSSSHCRLENYLLGSPKCLFAYFRMMEECLMIDWLTYLIQLEKKKYTVISCIKVEEALKTMKWNISQQCVQLL